MQAQDFADVDDSDVHAPAIRSLAEAGAFEGTQCAPQQFCPQQALDRKTMAVWIIRVLDPQDPDPVNESRFNDIDASSFEAPFIESMAQRGITAGCGDGTRFCPDRAVTRAQMAVFLSRAYDLPAGPDPGFDDVSADSWYGPDVAKLAASGNNGQCPSARGPVRVTNS